jgi:putative endonuclease
MNLRFQGLIIFMQKSYIYILANKYRTTFYIGVTANLSKRLEGTMMKPPQNSQKKYNTKDLIYFE